VTHDIGASNMNKGFRLNRETGGSIAGPTHRIMVMLPEGSKVDLVGPVAGNADHVEVVWNGQSVWLFASDFEARATAASVDGEASSTEVPTEAQRAKKRPTAVKSSGPKIRRFNAAGRELF
jgi:hypothetical protein